MQISQTGLKAYCNGCRKTFDVNSMARQRFIENYDCDDCRLDETKGDEMAKAKRKGEDKPTEMMSIKDAIKKHPELVKEQEKEPDAVARAKEKPLEVQPKFEAVEDPEQKKIEEIHETAIHLKKVQKDRTLLSNEETRLNELLTGLMNKHMLTVYHVEGVKVEPPKDEKPKKFKVTIEKGDDEEE